MDSSIEDKLNQIMSDPEAMEQVKSLGKMLGLDASEPAAPAESTNDLLTPEALGKLTQLMPIINNARKDDDTTRLLAALRPFLSEEKRRRLESAKKILMIIKLFPALKEVGLPELFS